MEEAPRVLRRHAANGITALRIAATPLFLFAVASAHRGGSGATAAALFSLIAATDFVDGRVARRYRAESRGGRVLDHFADIAFLVSALGLYAAIGTVSWLVPFAVAASFAAYVVDSRRRSRAPLLHLAGSRLGHLAGIANWVVVGILVFNETLALHWLPPILVRVIGWLVPVYSAAAITTRLAAARH